MTPRLKLEDVQIILDAEEFLIKLFGGNLVGSAAPNVIQGATYRGISIIQEDGVADRIVIVLEKPLNLEG